MARNDTVLLDGILDQRVIDALPSTKRDEVFEYLALEQCLKDFDLSREEIESGWTDGRDDGGLDGFYTIVNGQLVQDVGAFPWPKRNATIDVYLLTAKHHATFEENPLTKIHATFSEVFDLAVERTELKGSYSEDLLAARSLFQIVYRRLAALNPELSFHLIYASRGDAQEVGDSVRARARQLEALAKILFSSACASFEFVGASELVALCRRIKRFSLELPFIEYLAQSRDSYVLLVRLHDYYDFVRDEESRLRRYLFDSNVRDYLNETAVNEDIAFSLADPDAPEFWWLNNGVTILATGANVVGKSIQLRDVQIVNGLQTTESTFRHFDSGSTTSAERGLLVKVLVSDDAAVRDRIIRATNNQTPVQPASLHATDKIQRDIEDVLERTGWFYERRTNYYRNIGRPPARFVTPMYIAAGFVALVLRNPERAAKLKSRHMRNPDTYAMVFSVTAPLAVWPAIVEVLKRVESVLEQVRPVGSGAGERFLARARNLVALVAIARVFGKFSYSIHQLISLDISELSDEMILEVWRLIDSVRGEGKKPSAYFPARRSCEEASNQFQLDGIQMVGRRVLPDSVVQVDATLLDMVDHALPDQPWRPGVHREVAQRLKIKASRVSAAIQLLMDQGRRMYQRDGVVFDADGNVIAIDSGRTK